MDRMSEPLVFAAWSKDEDNRYQSTSGGIFSELAKVVFDRHGVVAGAQYNNKLMVEHTIIDNPNDLWRIRQSKYISSNPGYVYREVKRKLNQGIIVCFCGSPCQIAGLYSFLGTEPSNLITIDFICRGMNSPKALKSWLAEIENEEKNKVTRVWFKYKEGGWKSSPRRVRLDFEDGHCIIKEGENNLFMHGYLTSNLYIRPSCGNCKFKGIPRTSDITLADYWGIEKELDDDKGTSLVLINSDKGKKVFDEIKQNIEWHEKKYSSILAGNPMFSTSVTIPLNAHEFLSSLDTLSFSEAIKKYTKQNNTLYFRVKKTLKKILMVKRK